MPAKCGTHIGTHDGTQEIPIPFCYNYLRELFKNGGGGGGPGTQLSLTIGAWSLVVPSENANKASQALVGL